LTTGFISSIVSRRHKPPREKFFVAGQCLSLPKRQIVFPSQEHNGTLIEVISHYGYCIPDKGPSPASRMLYAARDEKGERHWRGSKSEIASLIDRNFSVPPLAPSGI
jgi:hypothetical protein